MNTRGIGDRISPDRPCNLGAHWVADQPVILLSFSCLFGPKEHRLLSLKGTADSGLDVLSSLKRPSVQGLSLHKQPQRCRIPVSPLRPQRLPPEGVVILSSLLQTHSGPGYPAPAAPHMARRAP